MQGGHGERAQRVKQSPDAGSEIASAETTGLAITRGELSGDLAAALHVAMTVKGEPNSGAPLRRGA